MVYRLQNLTSRPAVLPHAAAKPALPRRSVLDRVGIRFFSPAPLNPASINRVDPQTLQPTNPAAPAKTKIEAPARKRISFAPALAAGGAALLVPALAFAGDLGAAAVATGIFTGICNTVINALAGVGFAGYLLTGIGVALTVKLLWTQYQAKKPENVQSPNSIVMGKNPTVRKLFRTLIAPAFGTTLAAGLLMTYSPLIEQLITQLIKPVIGLKCFSLTWGAFWVLLGLASLKTVAAWTRDLSHANEFHKKGIQTNVFRSYFIPQALTELFANGAWFTQVVLMAHFSKIFTTQFVGAFFNATSNTFALLTGTPNPAVSPAGMAIYALLFGAGSLAFHLIFGEGSRNTRAACAPLEKYPPLILSAARPVLFGAAAGALLCLTGGSLLAACLLTFIATLSFGHAALHSTMSQKGAIREKNKIYDIFDQQSTWEAARNPAAAFRTVFKPSVGMRDPLISSYVMALITEGANWVLSAISGCYHYDDYEEAQLMIEKLINPETKKMRAIIKGGYAAMKAAAEKGDQKAATAAVADTFEATARFLDKSAKGNLREISGLKFLQDGFLSSGMPGSRARRGDQDLRVHGEHIRFAARIYEEMARRIRGMGETHGDKMQPASLQKVLTEIMEAYHRRAFPHCDTHPARFYTNFLPDSYNAKQFVIDLCSQVMSDFVGAMDVVVLNQRGETEIWLVPLKVVKDVDENYAKVLTLEDRDDDREDSRFSWYERETGDIGDSLCEIAYIDNSAHFARHGRDRSQYPTAEVTAPPQLGAHEYYDVVYKNGARLRIFGSGRQEIFGELPPNAAALLMLPGTGRHNFVAQMIQCRATDTVLYGIPVDQAAQDRLAEGDVPAPPRFIGPSKRNSLSKNPLFMPRWRFMYPTEFTSISDADQMCRAVTNLRLFHARAYPHLRVMLRRTKEVKLPFDKAMLDNPDFDSFLEVGIATVWMLLRVKLKNGRELTIPLNMNKENETTFGGDIWKYINPDKPVEVVAARRDGPYIKIPYREQAAADPAFRRVRGKIEYVPMPIEMHDLAGQIEEIHIDPVRYGETGGPIAVADYLFIRMDSQEFVTDKKGERRLHREIAQMLIYGTTALARQEEVEHACLTRDDPTLMEKFPYVDPEGTVHIHMKKEEYDAFQDWIPAYHGEKQPVYREGSKELLLDVAHFTLLCDQAYQDFSYRRFVRTDEYPAYFDPSVTW